MYKAAREGQIHLYAQRLQEERKTKGLTQQNLAMLVSSSKQVISRIENEKNNTINLEFSKKLAEHLDCTADYLIGDSDVKHLSADGLSKSITFDSPAYRLKEKLFNICGEDLDLLDAFLMCLTNTSRSNRRALKAVLEAFSLIK